MKKYTSISFEDVKREASGRWPEVLSYLGLPAHRLTGKHTDCACGGKDRFRYLNDDDGGWVCGQGGITTGGDGFDLLVHYGWSKADALHATAQFFNVEKVMLSPEQRVEVQRRKRLAKNANLDDGIYHECHILMQTTAGRKNNRDLEHNRKFREERSDWTPYPEEVWDREQTAAKRLIKMLEKRYDV
jgi:phage/plasmid primase-like uncharacterized protein